MMLHFHKPFISKHINIVSGKFHDQQFLVLNKTQKLKQRKVSKASLQHAYGIYEQTIQGSAFHKQVKVGRLVFTCMSEVQRVRLSRRSCMIKVLSLYDSSPRVSNSAIASSNAYSNPNINTHKSCNGLQTNIMIDQEVFFTCLARLQARSGELRISQ